MSAGGPASLPRSLFLQVLLPRAGVLLGWLALNRWTGLPVLLIAALVLADLLFLLWQVRTFQRSADAHVRSTGAMAPVWGGQLLLLFSGLAALALWWAAFLASQHVEEDVSFAEQRAMDREALYSLTVSSDGSTLLFDGEITFGLTTRLRQIIEDSPDLQRVELSGPGGLIAEARGAARQIRDHGLDTAANGLCASACTLIFAAGRHRSLGVQGQLGFHSYTLMLESGLPQVDVQREQEKDRAFLLNQGVSRGFTDRLFAVPGRSLWVPDRDELQEAGVLTARK